MLLATAWLFDLLSLAGNIGISGQTVLDRWWSMSQATIGKGQIQYVNRSSGCGFIVTETTDQDVLFGRDAVVGPIPEVGQEVEFEIVETNSAPRARKFQRV